MTPTQSPAAESVMDIHSCSYYCQLPKCVLRQRDELVRVYVEGWKEKEPTTPPAVEGDPLPGVEVPCNMHPDAPHGFDRNASHSEDRYVCDCQVCCRSVSITACTDTSAESLLVTERAITAWNTRQAAAEVRGGGWRPIEGRHGYEVSHSGEVRRTAILPQSRSSSDYRKVSIEGMSLSVARLVATAFIPNEDGLPEVNHKDGNKGNNAADNLEWCTRSENMLHAYATGLHPGVSLSGPDNPNWGRKGALHNQSVAVRATFQDGSHKDYESQAATADDGFKPNKVSECITGKRKSHGGATWQPLPSPPGAVGE